jgi:hypothetical protein
MGEKRGAHDCACCVMVAESPFQDRDVQRVECWLGQIEPERDEVWDAHVSVSQDGFEVRPDELGLGFEVGWDGLAVRLVAIEPTDEQQP